MPKAETDMDTDSTDSVTKKKPTASPSPSQRGHANVRCLLCGHEFHPGGIRGNLYCTKCGRRFNPWASMDETVAISSGTFAAISEDDVPLAEPHKTLSQTLDHRTADAGKRFGEYDILSEIARGGMGVVYRAQQRNLRRVVALKVLRGGDGATDEDLVRFMREAKAAASLSHPNIVPIHELNIHNDQPFFTMDYIEGSPLDQLIEQGTLSPNQACEYIETIAHAIHYAHEQRIIHRDLKPANIIIDRGGNPMITDFGLAVNLTNDVASQRMTRTGAVMGTIPYIPPEQASGHVELVDRRSDVYSLGAILYEMLTGQPPFQGTTQFELLRQVIHREPAPPHTLNQRIHPDVETICLKCLDKDPERRYQTAAALAEDCRAFLDGEVINARPATIRYRVWRYVTRRRSFVGMVGCIILLTIALWINYAGGRRTEKQTRKELSQVEEAKAAIETKMKETLAENEKNFHRHWRQEFFYDFRQPPDRHAVWLSSRFAKRNPDTATLRIEGTPRRTSAFPVFRVRQPVSGDFQLRFRLFLPLTNAGTLILTGRPDHRSLATTSGWVIRLGVAGNPGAKISRGLALIAEAPKFELTPDIWHTVEVIYTNGALQVSINDTVVMAEETTAQAAQYNRVHLGLGAQDGTLTIDDISVAVQGLSRANITSLIEIASSLEQNYDLQFANKLYDRVAREGTQLATHIIALRGFARTLPSTTRRRARGLAAGCIQLSQSLKTMGRLDPGEAAFLRGIAFAELPIAKERKLALPYFAQAIREAEASLVNNREKEGDKEKETIRSPTSTAIYALLAKLEMGILYLRLRDYTHAAKILTAFQKDGTLQRIAGEVPQGSIAGDPHKQLLRHSDRLISRGRDFNTVWSLLDTIRLLFPNSGHDLALRYHRLAARLFSRQQYLPALKAYQQAIDLAPTWHQPRFDLARVHFFAGSPEVGLDALAQASAALPKSFELQLAIATFHLQKNNAIPAAYRPDLAGLAAQRAVELSEKKNPLAWEIYARALFLSSATELAHEAITNAMELEDTKTRRELLKAIIASLQETNNSLIPPPAPQP